MLSSCIALTPPGVDDADRREQSAGRAAAPPAVRLGRSPGGCREDRLDHSGAALGVVCGEVGAGKTVAARDVRVPAGGPTDTPSAPAPGRVRRVGSGDRAALHDHPDGPTGDRRIHRPRIRLAGRTDTLFSDDAVLLIHEASRGLPRQVNNLATQSLIAAYTTNKSISATSRLPCRARRDLSPNDRRAHLPVRPSTPTSDPASGPPGEFW
jgi:hypothetical protein